jgi:hypothetical protein
MRLRQTNQSRESRREPELTCKVSHLGGNRYRGLYGARIAQRTSDRFPLQIPDLETPQAATPGAFRFLPT